MGHGRAVIGVKAIRKKCLENEMQMKDITIGCNSQCGYDELTADIERNKFRMTISNEKQLIYSANS